MRIRIAAGVVVAFAALCVAPLPAPAAPHEARIPLRDGKLRTEDFSNALCKALHLPRCNVGLGAIDLDRVATSNCVEALNQALGDGCHVSVAGDALLLHVDPAKLPRGCGAMSKALRVFAAAAAPDATAAQAAGYGLRLPDDFNPGRPLVVLVHGLDCDPVCWDDLTARLRSIGWQAGYFSYPSDQPIRESAALLGRHLTALHTSCPNTRVDLLAYSMGGLVSREYVEGPGYAGGIDRLIMVAPPNAGSGWARFRLLLEINEHYSLWRHDPRWRPSWMITDGFGEAGRDLKPRSTFLQALNARPRREGVKYTIIAGRQSPARRLTADCLSATADCVRGRAAGWWGFRQCKSRLGSAADHLRDQITSSDGPVTVRSARLAGVDDFVLVQADHATLCSGGAAPPAAWDAIRQRLTQ